MLIKDQIAQRIQAGLSPERLEVLDESEQHRGHAGYRDGGQSHFRVRMACASLSGLSRIGRHRAVHDAIGTPLMQDIHALAIEFIE